VRLAELLDPELVLIDPPVGTREELFARFGAVVARRHPQLDRSRIVEVLLEREAILATGVGKGIAVPHGQLPDLDGLVLAASTHPGGLAYPSLDGEPVRLVFCLLGGPGSAARHLACLARIARLARHASSLDPLVSASSPQEFLDRLRGLEEEV